LRERERENRKERREKREKKLCSSVMILVSQCTRNLATSKKMSSKVRGKLLKGTD